MLDNIQSIDHARKTTEMFIANISKYKSPFLHSLLPQTQLAKADLIPVCDDSVTTSFQGLHFDMGQPFFSKTPQDMYLVIDLYLPKNGYLRVRDEGNKITILKEDALF